jgi:methyl-accepting chemotaxis protein
MKIRTKITAMGLLLPMVPVMVVLALIADQRQNLETKLGATIDGQIRSQLKTIVDGVYALCQTQDDSVQQTLTGNLNVARDVLQRYGAVTLSPERVAWAAKNQLTGSEMQVALPKLLVGETWLGQIKDTRVRVPVIDDTSQLVGSTCTVFQRINEQGDMLRVATNVVGKDSNRAVGTYIPAANPDGSANAVVAAVLAGNTYRGRAFVVDSWYITAYEPIRDRTKAVVGMLYVGVKQENVASFRKSIQSIKVGATGYVYVLGSSGDTRGRYIISKDGARDGEDIWNAKDSDGRPFIQDIVNGALKTKKGDVSYVTYPWKNAGETTARVKIAAVTYFAPWDWVIGAGGDVDEIGTAKAETSSALARLLWIALGAGLAVVAIAVALALMLGAGISRPIARMVDAAQRLATGDLSQDVSMRNKDEMGDLALAFNRMSATLNSMMREVLDSSSQVASSSEEISASAQQLASSSQAQASTLKETSAAIEELTASVDQVSGHAQSQAASVEESSASAREMQSSVEQVSRTLTEVSTSSQDSLQRATSGADAVHKAVDSIKAILESSEKIAGIVNVISDIADQTNLLALNASIEAARAGEHGRGFAVVADEVSKLADRSSTSTKEIEKLIKESGKSVNIGVETAGAALTSMEAIIQGAAETNEMVTALAADIDRQLGAIKEMAKAMESVNEMSQSIFAATEEQTTNAKQVARAIENANEQTQSVASASEEVSASTEELSGLAQRLQELVQKFRLGGESTRPPQSLPAGYSKQGDGESLPAPVGAAQPKESTLWC